VKELIVIIERRDEDLIFLFGMISGLAFAFLWLFALVPLLLELTIGPPKRKYCTCKVAFPAVMTY